MKFRKKPVVIEAVQFFKANLPWPDGVEPIDFGVASREVCPGIKTLEGPMQVGEGDWIITGVKGEKYACKADIFTMTYERVEDA